MHKPKVTFKGQTTLPRDVQAALKIDAGDTLRYVVSVGEVSILKVRSVAQLSGMLKRPSQASLSFEAMDEAIAEDTTF